MLLSPARSPTSKLLFVYVGLAVRLADELDWSTLLSSPRPPTSEHRRPSRGKRTRGIVTLFEREGDFTGVVVSLRFQDVLRCLFSSPTQLCVEQAVINRRVHSIRVLFSLLEIVMPRVKEYVLQTVYPFETRPLLWPSQPSQSVCSLLQKYHDLHSSDLMSRLAPSAQSVRSDLSCILDRLTCIRARD